MDRSKGASAPEGHSSVGVTSPATTWYLPEGSTNWGFETWLLIQNPNATEASCDVTYMIEGEGPKTVNHKVPANSRESYSMADDIGSRTPPSRWPRTSRSSPRGPCTATTGGRATTP